MIKLCIIGAGSTVFTKNIITDLLLMDELLDAHKDYLPAYHWLEITLHNLKLFTIQEGNMW